VAAATLLAIMAWTVAFVVHSVLANMYYDLNYARLGTAAFIAVRAGAEYLPADPRTAIQVADESVKLSGILPGEIIFTRVAPDHRTLSIRLNRKMPRYIVLLAVGLSSREIAVTVSAQSRSDHPPRSRLQNISW